VAEGLKWHTFVSHIWSSGQDQSALIKRQLALLLPTIRVFLDVDNLEDISQLESYITETQCVIIFLSKGYFFSANCKRELRQSLGEDKPLCLVHERDFNHGGAPFDVLREDCPEELREALFDGRDVIGWYRIQDFQVVALKDIARAVLLASPSYLSQQELSVFIPGELAQQTYHFPRPCRLYVSDANPGAAKAADEMVEQVNSHVKSMQLQVVKSLFASKGSSVPAPSESDLKSIFDSYDKDCSGSIDINELQAALKQGGKSVSRDECKTMMLQIDTNSNDKLSFEEFSATFTLAPDAIPSVLKRLSVKVRHRLVGKRLRDATHYLLYLNERTFLHEVGDALAEEVRSVMDAGMPIIMLHENDPREGRDGCEFGTFFRTCPEDIIQSGLFSKLAIAALPEPYREVSFILAAKVLGAVNGSRFLTKARAKELLVSLGQRSSKKIKEKGQASSREAAVVADDEEAPEPSVSAPSAAAAPRPATLAPTHSATLKKTPLPVGWTLDDEDVVTAIQPDSQVSRAATISKGDQVLSINGVSPKAAIAFPTGTTMDVRLVSAEARREHASRRASSSAAGPSSSVPDEIMGSPTPFSTLDRNTAGGVSVEG